MEKRPKNAPMSSAPFVYDEKGEVQWDKMWSTFCVLAKDGGPAHRETVLKSRGAQNNVHSENYIFAVQEIIRAIQKVSGYKAWDAGSGWIGVPMFSKNMAKWFAEIITLENVECRADGKAIYLPVNDDFKLDKEIKNVVTVIAKSADYWKYHKGDFSKIIVHLFGKDLSKSNAHA
jgi:hypothetical protein